MRTLARSAVLITWLAAMAAIVLRTPNRPEALAPSGPVPVEAKRSDGRIEPGACPDSSCRPSEQWHGIYGNGAKIGYAHRLRTPRDDGFVIQSDSQMLLSMMGTVQAVRTHLDADTDRTFRLRSFVFRLRSGTIDFRLRGVARRGELELTSDSLGPRTLRVPMSTPIALSETLEDFLGQERLETGRTFRYALIDPVSNAPGPVSLTVGPLETISIPAGTTAAYRVDEEYQGSHFRLWVAPSGEVLKEEGPLGLTIVREKDARAAMAGIERAAGVDLAAAAAISVTRPIPSPRTTRRLRMRVAGPPLVSALSFPPRQRVDGDTLIVDRDDEAAIRSFTLPARGASFADDLRPTPFFQSDDRDIQRLAAEIVGADPDAARAARRILDWVHTNLAKVPTISVPNARQVLAERKGDCNEHAVLYAALARAAGLPARMAAGVVYMPGDDPEAAGSFYYHAWNEVWLGTWVSLDPTFGQFPADATHVELVEGGPDRDVALIGMLGRLRFDLEEAG